MLAVWALVFGVLTAPWVCWLCYSVCFECVVYSILMVAFCCLKYSCCSDVADTGFIRLSLVCMFVMVTLFLVMDLNILRFCFA